ncbi:hypothetical protein [Krasilnikovia sp. M28-CT-15]|uniref:hypothetical protein n=1 Tax=Krasilnikovia sp. M28-CT-15 TaxID=3373540 RepID=UPI00399CACF4
MALLAATGIVSGAAFATRHRRLKRVDPSSTTTELPRPQHGDGPAAAEPPRPQRGDGPAAAEPPRPQRGDETAAAEPGRRGLSVPPGFMITAEAFRAAPARPGVSRPLVRLAVAAAMIVVLAVVAAVATRPPDADRTALPDKRWQSDSPTDRLVDPSSSTAAPVSTAAPEPPAAVWGDSLASGGVACASATAPPVLNTVRPVLTAQTTASTPADLELWQENPDRIVSYDGGDLTTEGSYVTLYLRGAWRLRPGVSYRWRVRGRATDDWSPWCEFTISATPLDSLNLDEERLLAASLPPSKWRDIAGALGPGWPHGDMPYFWLIQEAGARVSAGEVPVSLRGWDWETVIGAMAEWASARNDPELWRLVDVLSTKVGGPPHPTVGFPRA